MSSIRRVLVAVSLLGLLSLAASSRAGDDPLPPEIQAIVDKIHSGRRVTPEDQKKLSDHALRHAHEPVDGTTLADVVAILESARKLGQRPTQADVDRMKKWAEGMKARRDRIEKDAAALEGAIGPRSATRTKIDLGAGVVEISVDVAHTTESTSGDERSRARLHQRFEASFPVRLHVKDAKGELRIDWVSREDKPATGSQSIDLAGRAQSPGMTRTTSATGAGAFAKSMAEGAVSSGELQASGEGRAWLSVIATTPARHAVKGRTVTTDANGTRTEDEDREQPIGPMAQLTLDELNEDSPLVRTALPPRTMKELRKQTIDSMPEGQRKAVKEARCSFDVAQFRRLAASGAPFSVPVRYGYTQRIATHKEGGDSETLLTEVRFTATLKFGDRAAELEVTPASKEAYERWLPVPYTKDEKVAKAFGKTVEDRSVLLELEVGFRPKPGSTDVAAGIIEIDLQDVSENPGVCCNYPPKDAKREKGLFFPPKEQDARLTVDPSGLSARTTEPVSSIRVKVAARDSGAYGSLVARCPERGTHSVWKPTGKDLAPIPDDDAGNHVTRSWGGSGRDASWDEDAVPAGQRRDGDGLTLYEEFRGFIVLDPVDGSWKHVRTNPGRKDLFIFDRDKLVHRYFAPYKEALGLELHYVDRELLSFDERATGPTAREFGKNPPREHRRININTLDADAYAPQYAVFCLEDQGLEGWDYDTQKDVPVEGGTRCLLDPRPETGRGSYQNPLRDQAELRINTRVCQKKLLGFEALIQAKAETGDARALPLKGLKIDRRKLPELDKNYLHGLLVHEMAHQVGVHHHHFTDCPILHDEKGRIVHKDEATGEIKPGWPADLESQSQSFGARDCALRYQQVVDWDFAPLLKNSEWPVLHRLCRTGEKVRFSDLPEATDKTMPEGCWEQVDVKSDPR